MYFRVPKDRLIGLGKSSNFWEMSDVGPCGVCTEIHYSLDSFSSNQSLSLENSLELWNLVFIEFER